MEVDNGRDDMLIDGQRVGNAVPDGFNPNYLKVYYGKLFPHADIFKWMSYGHDGKHPACDKSYFGRREFSFTLDNDIYLRFQSFNNESELENSIKEKCPFKIDIGPVYSVDPAKRHAYAQSGDNVFTPVERELIFDIPAKRHAYAQSGDNIFTPVERELIFDIPAKRHAYAQSGDNIFTPVERELIFDIPAKRHAYAQSGDNIFTPVERELIFDIDMSDYDNVRYCCLGADVCLDCWPLMTVAIKVIDTALRDDFGFNHILWVYSGRRGVHCWVCDGKARRLTNEQRAAIADYFRVYKGNENSNKRVSLAGHVLHPFLVRSYTEVLKDFFERKLLSSQNIFSTEEKYEKIFEMIPDESVTSELRGKWQNAKQSSIAKEDINLVRWKQLTHILQSGQKKAQGLRRCVEEIVFSFTYPRLDMEVSKHMNHLLKAPFCIHPKTGRVCVPIDPKHCEEFDPTTVPTLSQVMMPCACF
ncbi:hypothetical protein JCGZ_05702 [Jatropha curcas]|uniref:DNA primase n=1 Tax=Jatropha curcas TaxID=180498 RepID=A0A067LI38_JATCU|nr:hypothetical protein JCGZ_05702 [Jatropha curcas]